MPRTAQRHTCAVFGDPGPEHCACALDEMRLS